MNLGYDLFYDTSILLMPVIGSHFLLGIKGEEQVREAPR